MLPGFSVRAWTLLCVGWAVFGCAPEATPSDAPQDAPALETPTAEANGSAATAVATGPRVVFLGTSLTAGLGLRFPDQRWPERLGAMADSAGVPFEVVNAGRSGDTSAGGLSRLDWILREPIDILVLELGANDGLRGLSTEALSENLAEIIERTRGAWPEARVLLVGMEAPTNLGAEYTAQFREVFTTLASERDVDFVPFLLEGVAGEPELNQADRIHPTAAGHERVARTVWPHLEPLLEGRTGGSA
ncbi:MAG: arylesterase [Gemmatimonadetes bacterium]|nr:arylesterase [Gemmatimonadota bacterium]MBT8404191.1 arylesterase [Gemmatimonadota bacterium]NNK62575.1 arylesterase [Gemmatimonadota bacterium]